MAHALTDDRGGFQTIPMIDLGPLRGGGGGDPLAVAARLRRAASEVGFFYVMNHGVPQRTIDAAVDAAMRFFALPAKHKRAVRANGRRWGFVDPGTDADGDRGAGRGESFCWGTELPGNGAGAAPAVRNRWPDRTAPQMRHALDRYHRAALGCGRDLLRGLALGLALPEDFFLAKFDPPLVRGAVVYNRPQEPAEQAGAGAEVEPRTDESCLTLRWQDMGGGLQVMNRAGVWIAVPPIPGTLVASVGELMARWTDELFASTPHRMVGAVGRARFVVPVHIDPNVDAVIDPAEISPEPRGPRRHPPTTARERILARAAGAFA